VRSGAARSGTVAAVDLGATSGRVVLGRLGPGTLSIEEVHRFPNEPVESSDGLHWDILGLFREVTSGLRRAGRLAPDLHSIGVDSWAIDYGLLDGEGTLLEMPYHYRNPRTSLGVERVHALIAPERLYARTGIQFLPFNTLYQLAASRGTPALEAAKTVLLIPDLIGYWLSGARVAEVTNASTTGLFDIDRQAWAVDLVEELGISTSALPRLAQAGQRLGPLLPHVAEGTGLDARTQVTLVGSHDTASAVVGVPADDDEYAYISCGTWALVGLELERPIRTEESRVANFTNEAGVDGRVRYLRNVSGLWLLDESLRAWQRSGAAPDLSELLEEAAALLPGGALIDPNDETYLPPGDMPARIADACRRTGQPVPSSRAALVRCIVDSLAAAFSQTVREACRLAQHSVRRVHIVGGGSRNTLLCQLTANACELPVVAGPVEATAIGNVLVQGRAHGLVEGDLAALRALVRATQPLRTYQPRAQPAAQA
jgi:rhamnulokinase